MENNQFEWIDFYMKFANVLLEYKNNRKELISKLQNVHKSINRKFPKIESNDHPEDICPFTTFAMFNKGLTNKSRTEIIQGIANEFHVNAPIPTTFDGIPVVNNLAATFYCWLPDRGEHDIDNLWDTFEAAIHYADAPSVENKERLIELFDVVKQQTGVHWNLTMGLFWIRPYTYLNLDSRNRWFLNLENNYPSESKELFASIEKTMPDGALYFTAVDECKKIFESGKYGYTSFPQLSCVAWEFSNEINDEKSLTKKNALSQSAHIRWIGPIIQALRELGGSAKSEEVRNKIIENEHLADEEVNAITGKNKVNKFATEVAFARNDLAVGGYIDKSIRGIWTLTESGKKAVVTDQFSSDLWKLVVKNNKAARDESTNSDDSLSIENEEVTRYWTYSPGHSADKWDECYNKGIMLLGWGEIGNLTEFDSKTDMKNAMQEIMGGDSSYQNSANATWQFVHDMKEGDVIIAKKGQSQIIGKGVVTSEYQYDPDKQDGYKNFRQVNWTDKGSWMIEEKLAQKTLTDITRFPETVQKIKDLFGKDEIDSEEIKKNYALYTKDQFLDEVFISADQYETIEEELRYKQNIILQGAPGVGKTYIAKRLAYSMMGEMDVDRVAMVQFHQSYSYEDFIEGYRPSASAGFEMHRGAFYSFCKKAEIDSDNDYFFIIDEINRGNLSKIFGELFMLMEKDKRGKELPLLYSGELFSIPKNLYIIGMMNTADRSLAMLDYALRRRFAFIEIHPAFSSEQFKDYQDELGNEKFDHLISCIMDLNTAISNDESLGEGFCIGHSYFCNLKEDTINDKVLSNIIEFEIIPLLKEYWFDDVSNVRKWSDRLRSSIK